MKYNAHFNDVVDVTLHVDIGRDDLPTVEWWVGWDGMGRQLRFGVLLPDQTAIFYSGWATSHENWIISFRGQRIPWVHTPTKENPIIPVEGWVERFGVNGPLTAKPVRPSRWQVKSRRTADLPKALR